MNKLRNSIRVTAADGLSDYFVRLYNDFGIADNETYGNFAQNVERQIKKLNSAVPKTKKSPPQ